MNTKTFRDSLDTQETNFYLHDETSNALIVLEQLFKQLETRGWSIQLDQETLKNFPSIAQDYFEGRKKDLQFKARKYREGFKIVFFQEVNTSHKRSGYYDYKKLTTMPYLIRCLFHVELDFIKTYVKQCGYSDESKNPKQTAYEKVMHRIKTCWHYEENKADKQPDHNATDKDGKRLRDGQLKYFRDNKGRLQKGTVYHNINNMWWVILNKYQYRNIAAREFFDLDSYENKKRKLVKRSGFHNPKSRIIPEEYMRKEWIAIARKLTKEERVKRANTILAYLYKIDWLTRKFEFYVKPTSRLGLQEIESMVWNVHQVHDKPKVLNAYGDLPMSSSEGGWVKSLREYAVHGKPTITSWFCTDSNGYGEDSYKWVNLREKLWALGMLKN